MKRIIKATIFILLHTLIALLLSSIVSATEVATYGILGAALATLLLILFAGDEKSAKLFFAENWQELEEAGLPSSGLVFTMIGCIWLLPIFCFLLSLVLVALSRLGWI